MPSNKFLLSDKSKLLKTKLDNLSKDLQGSLESGEFQTRERYILEAIKTIQQFYKDLQEPRLDDEEILLTREDDLPDSEIYNLLWNTTVDDLITIFIELENIEDLTVANFNFVATESNRLTARLKTVSSLLGDFILYSLNPNRDSLFFKDSFNDLSKVDVGISLLNKEECEVNQAEGIVTLPIDKSQDSIIKINESPVINPNSNGIIGNNQEIGADFNGDLSTLLDNNPDTWFEFENIVTVASDDQEPLILDITLNVGEEKVINSIRINPNNFGTKTVIRIDQIETSIDGQIYTSVKDDIPIADFVEEDEDNVFSLAPSSSKFAGQGLYTFTPRKVKYVRFVFRQTEPFVIETSVGPRLRYAIGIRDIDIRNFIYLSEGEIISTPFETTDEVRKVLLSSNQSPTQTSELTEIEWFVSPDDGASWFEIRPKEFQPISGTIDTPVILEFNGPSEDTIVTPVPVKSLRVKAVMTREDDNFEEGSSTFNKTIVTTSEVQQVPQAEPFVLDLLNAPVDGSISLVDPLFGSRGLEDSPYIIGHAIDGLSTRKFRLPFTMLPRPLKKVLDTLTGKWHTEATPAEEWIHVEIAGERWLQTNVPIDTLVPVAMITQRVYTLDILRGILEFGNGENSRPPGPTEPVSLFFEPEQIFPNEIENVHEAKLDFATSSNKDDMIIERRDEIRDATEVLPRKATIIRLENDNITDISNIETTVSGIIFDVTGTGGNKVTFLNGSDELINPEDWSIDNEHATIYLNAVTPDDSDKSVSYQYQPIQTLTQDQWDFATGDITRDSVSIKESAWKTREVKDMDIPVSTGVTVMDLSDLSVEKGTLILITTVSGVVITQDDPENPFQKEVDFINGSQELGGEVVRTKETIPKNLTSAGSGLASFELNENITVESPSIPAEKAALFSNSTIFVEEKDFSDGAAELVNIGD